MNRATSAVVAPLAALLLGACQEYQIVRGDIESVATTAGDFDRIDAPLDRMNVAHQTYEGIISAATWDRTYDPEDVALKVEALFTADDEMQAYDALFVASGTRGLGQRVYNGIDDDDAIVGDATALVNTQGFVQSGRPLVATDWAYDLVEAVWPDQIEFLNEDSTYDAAQRGEIGWIDGAVVDEDLAKDLGIETISLRYDYSNWAVIESVGDDVTVHITGDVEYRLYEEGEGDVGTATLDDVPLLVSFQDGNGGVVLFSTFHLDDQSPNFVDNMLTALVGEFEPEPVESVGVGE